MVMVDPDPIDISFFRVSLGFSAYSIVPHSWRSSHPQTSSILKVYKDDRKIVLIIPKINF
jgi:hypothetical protein